MSCKTINEVILQLEQIIKECIDSNDAKGFFAVLYYKVTVRVRDGILKNEFDQNDSMELLDVLFANRYLEAYDSYTKTGTCTASWKVTFEAAQQHRAIVLQHIVAGMNAHINLDLGIAVEQAAGQHPVEQMQRNFFQINEVLATMMEGVKNDLGRMAPAFKWLMPLAKKWDEKLMQFSIETAREGAWQFANQLRRSHDKQSTIQDRDQVIQLLGRSLLYPGNPLAILIATIRQLEFKSVAQQLSILWNKSKRNSRILCK